jgi:uncharacterized protein (DUF1330 family)
MVALCRVHARKMRNPEEDKARPAAKGNPLKPLALYGKYEMLEGPAIEGAVVLEFPTVETAKTYYYSSTYQDAVKHRSLEPSYRVFIVEGV